MRPKQVTEEDWKVEMETESRAGRMTRGRAPGPRLHRERTQATETSLQSRLQGAGGGRKGKTVTLEKAGGGHGRAWGFDSNESRSIE